MDDKEMQIKDMADSTSVAPIAVSVEVCGWTG